jgi:hypothetical protein
MHEVVRLWHIADDVLIGWKVRCLSNFSAAPHFGERPESALCRHIHWHQGEGPLATPSRRSALWS